MKKLTDKQIMVLGIMGVIIGSIGAVLLMDKSSVLSITMCVGGFVLYGVAAFLKDKG